MAKKAEPNQVRIAHDVLARARVVAALKGEQVGDFLSDLLRPQIERIERELIAERARELDAPAAKKGK